MDWFKSNVTFSEDFHQFVEAIDWKTDFWIVLIFCVYLFLLMFVILFRQDLTVQCVVFFSSCVIVWTAQYLNVALSQNWELFSSQNYFDESGLFMTVIFSLPIVSIALISLFFMLRGVSLLLVQVKRAELVRNAKKTK